MTLKEVRAEIVGLAFFYVYVGGLSLYDAYSYEVSDIWPYLVTRNKQILNLADITTLTTTLDLYELSDLLMMPKLRYEAADLILSVAQLLQDKVLPQSNKDAEVTFASALDLIYENTHREDKLVRLPVTKLCLSHQQKLIKMEGVVNVMNKHEPITWAVWNDVLDNKTAAVGGLRGRRDGAGLAK